MIYDFQKPTLCQVIKTGFQLFYEHPSYLGFTIPFLFPTVLF